jgi:hypothetical protein
MTSTGRLLVPLLFHSINSRCISMGEGRRSLASPLRFPDE